MTSSLALSTFAATLLTPLVVTLWSRAFPPAPLGEQENEKTLRARFAWIDGIATMFMFVGLFLPLVFFGRNFNSVGIWAVGLMFGLMVSMHFLWVCVATIPFGGLKRFREFWRFYELRWGIAMKGIRVVYIPISLVGLFSAVKIWA
jgi:hypothetical protein